MSMNENFAILRFSILCNVKAYIRLGVRQTREARAERCSFECINSRQNSKEATHDCLFYCWMLQTRWNRFPDRKYHFVQKKTPNINRSFGNWIKSHRVSKYLHLVLKRFKSHFPVIWTDFSLCFIQMLRMWIRSRRSCLRTDFSL